ncbi:glycerol-3-phosphate dehydrogenase, mitochondrial [Drosophila innubila]|uniref:glycerol-3-phosphate dehydrogenase, mitochondrial n=1 Tax=Drosophila innubila TaxID=198719 RepID=UPI00148C9E2A|nr:glycerol-3-phosphate dehydrogenase, mitochondrial [Drosophila innubila]
MIPRIQMGLKRCFQAHPKGMFSSLGNIFCRNQSDECEVNWTRIPTRRQQLSSLRQEDFDVLVIGGGAIGCGCALEAATRGLKTALIEAGDFGNGASCKSSKLVEGGSSYLQAAIQGADLQQIYMLQQVLTERATMLRIAPHLNRVQPMLMPIYSPLRLPFYWLGLKVYDAMAGMANVRASHFLSQEDTLNEFPLLRRQGLLGSLVYYDGQMDDARMCLALAMTAAKNNATVANYVKLQKLMPPEDNQGCRKAVVEDTLTKSPFMISSRCLINATGAGTDVVRKLDDCKVNSIALPKVGTHIALPGHFGSSHCGLLFPSQQLGEETMFMLPFENRVLVGSVYVEPEESKCFTTAPKIEQIDCLLAQTREVLDDCALLRPDHVLSAWTGVMPSIMCPTSNRNEGEESDIELVPNFLIEVSGNQMITLAGGRWSSYRVMASDAIDAAIEHCCLEPQIDVSSTQNLLLDGAEDYYSMLPLDLVQHYDLPMDVAQHLSESYGCNAFQLLMKTTQCDRQRLHPHFPYIKAEVDYACRREYACQLVDVIARRLRVAFVDASAAYQMLPTVLEIMSKPLAWDEHAQELQLKAAKQFLMQQMGLGSVVKYNPLFTDQKEDIKASKSQESVAKSDSNSREYRRTLTKASTSTDIGSNNQTDIAYHPITAIADTVEETRANTTETSEITTSGPVYRNNMDPKRVVVPVLNNTITSLSDEMQPFSGSTSDMMNSRHPDSLAGRISRFQSRDRAPLKTSSLKCEAQPTRQNDLDQTMGTTGKIDKLNSIKPINNKAGVTHQQQTVDTVSNDNPGYFSSSQAAQSYKVSDNEIPVAKKKTTVTNQAVNNNTLPGGPSLSKTVGNISTPNQHPKHTSSSTSIYKTGLGNGLVVWEWWPEVAVKQRVRSKDWHIGPKR